MKRQSIRAFLTHVSATLYLPLVTFVTFALGPFLSVSLLSVSLSLSLSPLNYELHRLIPPSPRCLPLLLISKPPKRRDWRRISGALASVAVLEEDGRVNKVKVPENEDDDGGFPSARAQEFLISLIRVRRFCIYYWIYTHISCTHTYRMHMHRTAQ